jgi:hypothetical protein
MKNFPMLVVGLLLTAGCNSATNTPQLTSLQIGKDVPLEASSPQVIAFLESKHIEHSGYRVDPTKGRIITAISRDRSKWHLIREDHVVDFRFDSSDRLIAKDGYDHLTGP